MALCYLLALLDARPSGPRWGAPWLSEVFAQHLLHRVAQLDPEQPESFKLSGWSVGSVVGNETFVQARPLVRGGDADPSDDVLRTPALCTIASFMATKDDEPLARASPQIRLARFRRWIGARAETELSPEVRVQLRTALPDFLARGATLGNDGELVFLSFLGGLHRLGGLSSMFAAPELIRRALGVIAEALGTGDINLMVSDGRTLGVIHRGGTLLAMEPPVPPAARGAGSKDRAKDRGNLLWFDPGPPLKAPVGGAERIAEGIFTVDPLQPRFLHRD